MTGKASLKMYINLQKKSNKKKNKGRTNRFERERARYMGYRKGFHIGSIVARILK